MTLEQRTIARPRAEPAEDAAPRGRRAFLEPVGYAAIAVCLAVLMVVNVRNVDLFYLDEWFYVSGARYIWEHFPVAILGTIPEWNRGPQRLYSTLLAPATGLLDARAAYTAGLAINVALLSSTVIPLALLARRVIASPALRVLAVALGTAIPWLIISAHLLTENLAFPLFVWTTLAIVVAAERPTRLTELLALLAIGLIALCRLNLAPMFGVLVLAALADEVARYRRREPGVTRKGFLRGVLRRRPITLVATVLGVIGGLAVLSGGAAFLGAYGNFSSSTITDGLFGAGRADTFRTLLTYFRGLVEGTFVLPVALGLAVGLAGAAGRLGRAMIVPAVATLAGLLATLLVVAIWTKGASLEERYIFYPVAPLAVLAVAGLEHLRRLRGWIAAGAALAFWPFVAGAAWPGTLAEHFFSAPGKAFWSRVVDARVRQWEGRLLGWTLIPPTGWLLVAVGLVGLVLLLRAPRTALVRGVLTGALALCVLMQALALNYDFHQELYGTTTTPGGIAGVPGHPFDERPAYVDGRTGGAPTAVIAGMPRPGAPIGQVERQTFWNGDITGLVDLRWSGAPYAVPPGIDIYPTQLGPDGLAEWTGEVPKYLVAVAGDPRVQFASGAKVAGPATGYQLRRSRPVKEALWTARSIEIDGALIDGQKPAELTLNRAAAGAAPQATLTISLPEAAEGPSRWTVDGASGKAVAHGRIAPGQTRHVRLTAPACPGAGSCAPARWTLEARGRGAKLPLPVYGAPPPPRDVVLQLGSVDVR